MTIHFVNCKGLLFMPRHFSAFPANPRSGVNKTPTVSGRSHVIAVRPVALAIHLLIASGASFSMAWAANAQAQVTSSASMPTAAETRRYDIGSGPLSDVLTKFSTQSGAFVVGASAEATGKTSPGVRGTYTVGAALQVLLAGTGLQAVQQADGSFSLIPAPVSTSDAAILPAVTVTASRVVDPSALPEAYAGGQVARGGRLGMLGNVSVMDAPFNITSYTAKTIEDQQASTLADVLDNDSSVRRSSSSSGQYEYFWVRGFTVYSNDIAFNGLYGLSSYWGTIPTEFAERVELLKGPSALLNGMSPNGAVGGSINIVPKRAADEPLTRITTGLDSDSYWKTHVDVGRRFGERGEWGVRVNGVYGNGDTYIDGQSKKDYSGAVALDYRGDRVRLALDAWRFRRELDGGSSLNPVLSSSLTSVPKAPSGSTNLYPGTYSKNTTQAAILSGEFDINDAWTAYAKIGHMSYDYRGVFGSASGLQQNGDITAYLNDYPMHMTGTSGETGLRGKLNTGPIEHSLVLSASYVKQVSSYAYSSSSQATNIYNPSAISSWPDDPGALAKGSDSTLSGIALADTLHFANDRVLLTLGARDQRVQANNYDTTTGALTSSYDKSAVTPMVGLVVKPRENLSLYANYIEGLSQGSTVGTGYANAGEIFAPYKTKQMEIGAKLETGTFTNTLSLFQISKPSTTTDSSDASALPTMRLDGEQRNRGIEWNVFGELTRGVRVLGGVTYTQGRLVKTQSGTNNGNQAPGAAPWAANLGSEWDIPGIPGLTVDGRVIYTSSQYVNSANTLKIPSWTRVDVGARYATRIYDRPVVFRAGIRNLFGRDYWEGVYTYSGFLSLGAARTFMLSATMDF
ncbi:TonB-dependent receptor [Paraburkholderia tropica]|uniref:TonB-dependent receptor n=1 Tax=Paraburkholderia tropica TaxID=92647 RepID=UPI002AB6FE84|nr:TonB-dependent receptor [Paraburkholderia tropica]